MKCLGGLFCSRFPFFSSGPPALSAIAAARAGTSEGSAAPAPLPSRPEARLPPLSPRPSSPASPSPPAAAPGLVHLPAKGGGDRGPASRSAGGLGKGGRCGARPGRRRRPDSSALAFSFAPSPVSASLGWAGQGRAGPGVGCSRPAGEALAAAPCRCNSKFCSSPVLRLPGKELDSARRRSAGWRAGIRRCPLRSPRLSPPRVERRPRPPASPPRPSPSPSRPVPRNAPWRAAPPGRGEGGEGPRPAAPPWRGRGCRGGRERAGTPLLGVGARRTENLWRQRFLPPAAGKLP